ncbi:MAG: tetratricopeptide repeat protein [Ferruginibacter sp.]
MLLVRPPTTVSAVEILARKLVYSLGRCYYNKGDKMNAKKYSKVLELDPASANAKQVLEKIGV